MLDTAKYSPLKVGVQKKLLTRKIEVGVVTLVITLITITCILSILLLIHSNEVATKGYELKSLEGQKKELFLYNQRLKAAIAEKKSLKTISSNEFIASELRPIRNIVILNGGDTKLVKK